MSIPPFLRYYLFVVSMALPLCSHAQTSAGSALSFDGADDFVSTSPTASPQNFTASLWFKTTTAQGGRLLGFGNSQSGLSTNFDRALYMNNTGQIRFGVGTPSPQTIGSSFSYNDGNWHHAAGTFSTTAGMNLYIDGTFVDGNPVFTNSTSYAGSWRFGWDNLSGWPSAPSSFYFNGQIDEAQIWNKARTQSEIQSTWHQLLSGNETNLAAYWYFDENTGTTTADASNHGLTGTLNNGTAWVVSTAPAGPPVTTTLPASSIVASGATLGGTVNPDNQAATAYFQYGTTTNYGSTTAPISVGGGTSAVPVNVTVSGLLPNALYHFRIVASNTGGTAMGGDVTFTTALSSAPLATTLAPTAITPTNAILNGTVNPNSASTTVWFDWGTTTNYGNQTAQTNVGSGATGVPVGIPLTGLVAGTTIHYRCEALNAQGTSVGGDFSFRTPIFTTVSSGLPTFYKGAFAWGDYDGDGHQDIVLAGTGNFGNPFCQVWRNTGSNLVFAANLTGVESCSLAWGDYDNDGKLDILLSGQNGTAGNGSSITQIWRNTGSGFTNINAALTGIRQGTAAWGDFNNDGKLDILLAGFTGSAYVSQIWRNTGNGFVNINANLPGAGQGESTWGDFDGDGWLDVFLTGDSSYTYANEIARVYRNNGDETFSYYAGLTGVWRSSVAVADYDNDGRLDIFMMGFSQVGPVAQIWRNTGNGFVNINAPLPAIAEGNAAWGDYDNDGRLDLLLSGSVNYDSAFVTQIWLNTPSGFVNINENLPAVKDSAVAWGHFNEDGRLDLLLAGNQSDFDSDTIGQLRINNTFYANAAPSAPAGLSASARNNSVLLQWNAATDSATASAGLTYNLRLGTTPGGSEIIHPAANADASRRLPQRGNAEHGTFAIVTNLSLGNTYYWSVQSVDAAFISSPFSTEQSFLLLPPTVGNVSASNITYNSAVLSGTINPRGVLTSGNFRYGTNFNYGSGTAVTSVGFSSNDIPITATLTNLASNQTYNYQLTATNNRGSSSTANFTFTTAPPPPTTTTAPATSITTASAILNASVNPNGSDTTFYFQYGPDTNYGSSTLVTNMGAGVIAQSISAAIGGLNPGTTYHFRVVASSSAGSGNGADASFSTLPVVPATATTLAATAVTYNNAKLNASVNPNGSATSAYFEYGFDTSYGNATATINLGNAATNISFSNVITNLLAVTNYHFRVVALSVGGVAVGADMIVTTPGNAPTVTTQPATGLTSSSATLNASVNPNGASASIYFQYGLTASYGSFSSTNVATGNVTLLASNSIPGLLPGTQYHYRVVAVNSFGTAPGSDLMLTTPPAAPAVTTIGSGNVSSSRALLSATVNPNGDTTVVFFEYSTNTAFNNVTVSTNVSGTSPVSLSLTATGLFPATVYNFRAAASNSVALIRGVELTLTTVPVIPPSATTLAADSLTPFTARLNASVNPNGTDTILYFEYGTGTNYGSVTVSTNIGDTTTTLAFARTITGLLANTIYHFRIVATNSAGTTTLGNDLIFQTPQAVPNVSTDPATSITSSSAGLNGTITPNGTVTTAWFEYGQTTSYGTLTVAANLGSGNSAVPTNSTISGLAPGVVYHYRAAASNSIGTAFGADASFLTLPSVTVTNVGFTNLWNGSAAWGDYDNDGYLDLLMCGQDGTSRYTWLYRNLGNGTFTNFNPGFPNVESGFVAWGDYDNDGDLDVAINGTTTSGSAAGATAQIFRNNGNGTFTLALNLGACYMGTLAWGDMDNDGRLDLFLTGTSSGNQTGALCQYWHSNTNGTFTKITPVGLPAVWNSAIALADFNNDGYLDVAMSGQNSSGSVFAQIYRNTGTNNTFTSMGVPLPGLASNTGSSVAAGDFDNDGYPDIAICGTSGSASFQIWRNVGNGTFTNINAG
ncbi:MAG: regulatory domain of in-like proprotein convertase, partial [Verrucomicrobiales bacterium]|nr:regulatory domain of in-like proprotein convertase [Verrucomicrobiales bacterium]